LNAKAEKLVFTIILINISLLSSLSLNVHSFADTAELASSSSAATLNNALSSSGMLAKATHVLVGTVEQVESRWDEKTSSIFTYVKVHVEERVKGTLHGDYVVIKHRGGEIENLGLRVSDEPSFLIGEKVKVFLRQEQSGEFTVIEGQKGKISLASPASSGYSYSGIHWDSGDLPVPFYINENGTPDVSGTAEEFEAVKASFQTWEDDAGSFMNYSYMGTTTRTNQSLDGYNVVSWLPIDGLDDTLALTTYWYNPSTQLMMEFDIVFDEDETWSATGEVGKHDIQNVGTHEVGHTLVLEDLYDSGDSEQTMYGYCARGETKKRTLEAGDVAGIRQIYPITALLFTITTNPSGLQIEVDGTTYTSPQSFEWTPNSTHTVNVLTVQSGGIGTRQVFTDWSDGGARQHQVTMGTTSVTLTANYVTQHLATIATSGLGIAFPALISYTQLGQSRNSSTSESWSDWCDADTTLSIDQTAKGVEGQRWLTHDAASWAVTSPVDAVVHYVLQYRVSLKFKTHDQTVFLQPTQVQILGGSPNNTLLTLRSYSNIWLDDVSWTLKQVAWQNSNVAPLDTQIVNLTPDYEWTITCRVYPISFEGSFKNFKGSALNENPSSFTLQFPNGTISQQLSSLSTYYTQNGTTRWESITWQGLDVAPNDAYFDVSEGNPTVNCLIYDFVVRVSDFLGFPVPGASVSVELPNGRTMNAQTGFDGVAVIRNAPLGEFSASVSFLAQTATVSGDVAEAALAPVEVEIALGLSILVLLFTSCALAVALVVLLFLRATRNRRLVMSLGAESNV
jgi:hypothetical protein